MPLGTRPKGDRRRLRVLKFYMYQCCERDRADAAVGNQKISFRMRVPKTLGESREPSSLGQSIWGGDTDGGYFRQYLFLCKRFDYF